MTAQDDHALSGAYVVDALDDQERTRFEQHLAGCEACRAEVIGLRETTAGLSGLVGIRPSARLRTDVLAEIRSVRPLPPEVPRSRPVRRRWWRPAPLVAAAVLLATTVVGTDSALHRNGPGLSRTADQAVQVLQAPDARESGVDLEGPASVRMVRSASVGRAVLIARELPALPTDSIYQLWWQNPDDRMISAGLMPGGGSRSMVLEGDVAEAKAVGITVEPAGGSVQPTADPIALFDLEPAT